MKRLKNIIIFNLAIFFILIFNFSLSLASDHSLLYKKYISIDEKIRSSPFELISYLNDEIRKGNYDSESYVLMSLSYLAIGDVENFVRNLKKANKLRSYKFKPYPLARYEHFINELMNLLRLIREINNRFEIYPNSSELYYQLAILCNNFDRKLAIKYLNKAIELYPEFLKAHLKIAELYEESMDYNRAIKHWKIIMDIRPYDFRPYYKICHLSSKFGNFTIAEEIYKVGMRKKMMLHEYKEFQEVIKDLVDSFPKLKKERELTVYKLMQLKDVVQNDPLNIDALLEIARIYYEELFDIKNAEQAVIKAIHVDQLNYKSHLLYSKILERLGEIEKAYNELLFAITYSNPKIKSAYITELTTLFEKKLFSDVVQKKVKLNELVDYFSINYND